MGRRFGKKVESQVQESEFDLALLLNTSIYTAALSQMFSIISKVHWGCCRVCRRAILICCPCLFSLCIWSLGTIRTVICGIRLFTAWRRRRCILAWPSPGKMTPFYKLIIVNHPKWSKIVFIPHKTFVKRKICSNRILQLRKFPAGFKNVRNEISTSFERC